MEPSELIDSIAKKDTLKSHLIHILEGFQQMDYHALNQLLDEGYYEDLKKTSFIYQQMQIFKAFQRKGDSHLNLSTNICTGCLCSEPVFVLTGNNSGHKYAIYVEFTQDDITDIYRCALQSDYFECLSPF
ncbi:hypothetical protein OS188_13845 [Xanthomarina sp. F1114]|uniref:hypothetical protein n=1 Tax=Xanthomarina sp. F1114 TaxID=2996019 RepID=UPI00225E2ECD|nr:hypothetical protein [Xanthomarina sp. F1114]MCX7549034.1 hypothetical protein [Xanthomarina sp. F1114]